MLFLVIACLTVILLGAVLLRRRARRTPSIQLTADHQEVLVAAAHGEYELSRLHDRHWRPVIDHLMAVGLVMLDEDEYEIYGIDITSAGGAYVTRMGLC